ncbi:hypothetical protein QJS10_CPB21g00767 [Acorus calamus]|uniref:Uncharacterized protein n=1 Tax=Acorus calamus TaxID=4465 RepID=A0AAV9C625_ACOCL|nr:hypothetical protein QJS10_CPB21g00767 [Acorus calamus]
MLAVSLLQRFTKIFELQIEEEQRKKNLQIGIDDEIQRLKVADEASSSDSHMVDEIEPLKHHSVIERVLATTRDETNRPLIQLQHIPVIAQNWTDEEELQRNQNDGAPAASDQTVRNAEPTEEEKKHPRNKE